MRSTAPEARQLMEWEMTRGCTVPTMRAARKQGEGTQKMQDENRVLLG